MSTLAELLMGLLEPTTGPLEAAAAEAQIPSFIESLPQGYATIVGVRAMRLSGGQPQGIGIARALYKRAPVLFFDEANSALDRVTDRALMKTLDSLSRELAIVMIAQRLSTTAHCDGVVPVSATSVIELPTTSPAGGG